MVNGKQAEVLEIETHKKMLESLTVGVPAGLLLGNIERSDVQRGNNYIFE